MEDATIAPLRVGVLALQGSFREHTKCLSQIPGVQGVEVRTKEELAGCAGLIIPGGESTTMALVAERWGLIPEMQAYAKAGKPIWGTCAGLIFLANRASGTKKGGQALLGGLDCYVHRNFFGAQVNSFETQLAPPACLPGAADGPFRAVFIRAPAVLEMGPGVEVLAEYRLLPEEQVAAAEATGSGRDAVAVAVRSGGMLATSFHPELTADLRWHQLFVEMVRTHCSEQSLAKLSLAPAAAAPAPAAAAAASDEAKAEPRRPVDLPVYEQPLMR